MVSVHLVPIRPTAATADDARRLAAALLDDPRPGAAVISAAWHIDETDAAPHDGELAVTLDGMAAGVGLALWAVRSGSWAVLLDPEGNYDKQSALSHITAGERRRARRAPGRLVLPHGRRPGRASETGREADLRCAEATLQLVATVERRRSDDQHAAGRLVEAGASQREAAAELGISQQAVHSRLRHGLWHESRSAVAAVLPLLERLVADPGE
ncbi:hypothetical protein M3B07_008010 [Micrococcus luteus]|uniref:hypothetical protein n=1 Tax=unclassified Micrococcus TaxID=2620948 RepID=UPI0008A663BF|nr:MULTISPECIES: hypothetical protein [unclassified Micrococcus]MCT1762162.1 hypothetical protein [Micrococcus luteus]MCV7606764.1 hypothetical protein [Micrococcus luteus]MCV7644969.1 hypothetical protein [Micrococcus luteus]MCV7683293.1 hypothetical protein [Micrococcus luteus]MCV7692780.1 hypothetical protein [Micrococcus luteus]